MFNTDPEAAERRRQLAQYWGLFSTDEDLPDERLWGGGHLEAGPHSTMLLTERANDRQRRSNLREDAVIDETMQTNPGVGIQQKMGAAFNRRGQGIQNTQWAPFFERLNALSAGGRNVRVGFERGGSSLQPQPHDFSRQLGPNFRNLADDQESTFNTNPMLPPSVRALRRVRGR